MNPTEAYFLLFTDSLIANLVISVNDEVVLNAMKIFGSYDSGIILTVVTIASIIAISLNYLFGRVLLNILQSAGGTKSNVQQQKTIKFVTKYKVFLLPLVVIPVYGKIIAAFAGFCRLGYIATLFICTISKFLYYLILLQ